MLAQLFDDAKCIPAIIVHLLFDRLFFRAVGILGEVRQCVAIVGEIFEAEQDDFAPVRFVGGTRETRHDETGTQFVSSGFEKALGDVRFFAGPFPDRCVIIVDGYGMAIVGGTQLNGISDGIFVGIVRRRAKSLLAE